jgi:hypothetical protein
MSQDNNHQMLFKSGCGHESGYRGVHMLKWRRVEAQCITIPVLHILAVPYNTSIEIRKPERHQFN